MLFSITALSFLGFYKGFTAYLGEGEDIVVVYDSKSHTPFTGLVPAYLSEKISTLKGVLASSPEIIVPCILKGKSIFLRGIVPENFTKLNQLTMIEGSMLNLDELNSIIIGKKVAERLHIKSNERILIIGVLTDRYVELNVKGIFISNSPLDDEILAPLYVGQWLRGVDYGYATLIRFKIDRSSINPSKIFEEIAKEASPSQAQTTPSETQPIRIIQRIAIFRIEDISVKEAYNFMSSYIERYGVTRESLIILSIMVFLFSSASIIVASKIFLMQHKGEIEVLRSIGTSKKLLKRDILIKLLPLSIIASLIGFVAALIILTIIQGYGYLQVLSHTIPLQIDLFIITINFILVLLLVTISILKSNIE
jgi:ABC-type lipoprotein release transport system permease subunit